jgi:hypothetical protein
MASYEQLIFAEVKNDGTGRYILVKVKDVVIGFSTPSASTILGEDIFVSSTIYDAAGNVLGVFTDAEVKSFTQEYISKGAEKIVTLKSKYIAESYAYFAVKDEEGNITGYKLQPKVIKAVQQKYITYRNNGSTVTESGETHTVEMQDGKWNIPGISDYGMAVNAEMTSSVFTVNGVTVVSNTDGYMVHVITPSAEGETFVFGTYTASEYVGKHKILKYAVDITEKTITVYGE